jgi:hypothetical protein
MKEEGNMPDKTSELIEYPLRTEGWIRPDDYYPLRGENWIRPDDHEAAEQWRALVKALGLALDATYVGIVTQLELALADVERLRRENAELVIEVNDAWLAANDA